MAGKKGSVFDPYTDWILENASDYANAGELLEDMEKLFGIQATKPTLKSWMKRRFGTYKICGVYREYTEEQKEFLKAYYPEHGAVETAATFNELFDDNRTAHSITSICSRMGVKLTAACNSRLLSKNVSHHSKYSLGHVVCQTYPDGQVVYRMKTEKGWQVAGKVVWENAYGSIPDGYKLIYLDGDNSNFSLDNLYLATNKVQYQVICNKNYKVGNPELTKALIKYYELRNALQISWSDMQAYERKLCRQFNMELLLDD